MKQLLLILAAVSLSSLHAATLTLNQPENLVTPGSVLGIQVVMTPDPDTNIVSYSFDVSFPTFLAYTGVSSDGDFLADGIGAGVIAFDNTAGTITGVNDFLISLTITSTQPIVNLFFDVNGNWPDTGVISLSNASICCVDAGLQELITPETTTASVTVAPEPATLLGGIAALGLLVYRRRIAG